jgi:hypothetical protein
VVNRKVLAAAGIGFVVALAACTAIIGTRDLSLATIGADSGAGNVGDSSAPIVDGTVDAPVNVADSGGLDSPATGQDTGADTAPPACGGANLQTDPHNCGTCGHDCLGGGCTAGACQPVTLVSGQPAGTDGIGLSVTSVYWANYVSSQIGQCLKDGGAVSILAQGAHDGGEVSSPINLVTDDQYVYWANNLNNSSDLTDVGRIARCPLAGCTDAGSQVVVTNLNYPGGMSVDDAGLYFGTGNADDSLNVVVGWSKADGGISAYNVFGGLFQQTAVDPSFVYWATNADLNRAAKDAGGPDGGPFTVLYAPSSGFIPSGIAIDGSNLYFVQQSDPDGLVAFIPKAGIGSGVPTNIATGLHSPSRLAVDATNVYWISLGPNAGTFDNPSYPNGTLMTCPKTGCPTSGPVTLAQNQAYPWDIVIDDVAVYWSDNGNNASDGAIMKIAK